ncbi:MAG: hypothetical protein NZ889_00800 [Candidatus Pacearchaeota archaeon]|nr:hypothetical protein [Candidatus Pacearchaeota archaeon]
MRYISSFVACLVGFFVAGVATLGLIISKGFLREQFARLPSEPSVYFIALIVLGVILIIISLKSR